MSRVSVTVCTSGRVTAAPLIDLFYKKAKIEHKCRYLYKLTLFYSKILVSKEHYSDH